MEFPKGPLVCGVLQMKTTRWRLSLSMILFQEVRLRRLSLFVLLLLSAACVSAEETAPVLKPSFPNHAMLLLPTPAGARASGPASPPDTETPFSWDQTVVLHEGTTSIRLLSGFDPLLQPVQFVLQPKEATNVRVELVDPLTGQIQATARANTGGIIEQFQFQVQAHDVISTEFFNLNYDIRFTNTRIRGTPLLRRSAGDFVKPGQIVRYAWTRTGQGEKRPKVEAEFSGRTGAAKGITSSTITEVLAVKAQPFVLGHYLLTVTPRDVRGEPPRGSTSNGVVFQCAFGSENLPPATDGLSADTFLPAVGQTVTMSPVAFDPETGQSVFDNETWDFGDGTVLTGITGQTTHAWATPGIYRVKCTVTDVAGLSSTAEDNIIVGAQILPKMTFSFFKWIIGEEGGTGIPNEDNLKATFKGAIAKAGDQLIFTYNRNIFNRLNPGASNESNIVLKPGGANGPSNLSKNFTATSSGGSVDIEVKHAQFDRTGDPRFGRGEFKGIFKNQRIALCVIPGDGSTPRAYCYTGNMTIKVTAGPIEKTGFFPEDSMKGSATTKEPNPKRQEVF